MPSIQNSPAQQRRRKRDEFLAFLFVTVILAPLLAVTLIGGYGLVIWIAHMFGAPPGVPVD